MSHFAESGNMIIMALSYAQRTGDNSHLSQYVGPICPIWSSAKLMVPFQVCSPRPMDPIFDFGLSHPRKPN